MSEKKKITIAVELPAAPVEEPLLEDPVEHEDARLDGSLRPRTLSEYIGHEAIKQNLQIAIEAAKQRADVLDHLLFCGPPGLGKTSLSHIIAREMDVHIHATTGPVIERPGDLAAILTNLDQGDVLFIDEIHRLSIAVEEVLYTAMEDFSIDVVVGQGPTARTVRMPVSR